MSFLCDVAPVFDPNTLSYVSFPSVSAAHSYCASLGSPSCFSQVVSCSPYEAPPSADTVFVFPDSCSGGLELSPSAVDSAIAVFNQGFQGGVLTFIPIFAAAVSIVVVVHLLSYAVSKS